MSDRKTEFIEDELEYLWSDLESEERYSLSYDPAVPSMAMDGIMYRIKLATELVGPVDWMSIPAVWLVNGRYEYWAKYMGIEYNLPTEDEFLAMTSKLEKVGWDEKY